MAFPIGHNFNIGTDQEFRVYNPGMKLLDWYAGQALPLVCDGRRKFETEAQHASRIARHAYRIAKAMMKESGEYE